MVYHIQSVLEKVESFAKEEDLASKVAKWVLLFKKWRRNILMTKDSRFNNRIMDAVQKLICKALDKIDSFQSVLSLEKRSN